MADKTNVFLTNQPKNPRFSTGTKVRTVEFRGSFTASNSAIGDKCILAGPLSLDDRIAAIRAGGAGTPALTSAADCDLGFFKKAADGSLVELSKDVLWNGITLASALTYPNLLTGLNLTLDISKNIGQHLSLGSDKMPHGGVFLVLTTNIANTATGPLLLDLEIDINEATTR